MPGVSFVIVRAFAALEFVIVPPFIVTVPSVGVEVFPSVIVSEPVVIEMASELSVAPLYSCNVSVFVLAVIVPLFVRFVTVSEPPRVVVPSFVSVVICRSPLVVRLPDDVIFTVGIELPNNDDEEREPVPLNSSV